MKSTLIKTAAALAAAGALAAYWYWSPFITLWQMRSAAGQHDASAFSRHVDYPSLRGSLKEQFAILFTDAPGQPRQPADESLAGAGAAFGKMLGLLVVDKFVDMMVRPEAVMLALQRGYLEKQAAQVVTPDAVQASAPSQPGPQWVYQRSGASRMVLYRTDALGASATAMQRYGLVLVRYGFADWKLAGVVLPAATGVISGS